MRYIVESDFEHNGLRCVVTFSYMGHRCGYVGVPKGNKYYGKGYNELYEMDCHGGLTYSSDRENQDYPIKSDLWWFGFDCAHYGDGKDLEKAFKDFPESRESIAHMIKVESMFPDGSVIRTQSYVEEECKHLAEQL